MRFGLAEPAEADAGFQPALGVTEQVSYSEIIGLLLLPAASTTRCDGSNPAGQSLSKPSAIRREPCRRRGRRG